MEDIWGGRVSVLSLISHQIENAEIKMIYFFNDWGKNNHETSFLVFMFSK